MAPSISGSRHGLARQARARFVDALDGCIGDLAQGVQTRLAELMVGEVKASTVEQIHLALEADRRFRAERHNWTAAARRAWRASLTLPPAAGTADGGRPPQFTLEDDAVVERKIIASRLAGAVSEAAAADLSDLKLRIRHLEQSADWPAQDVLRPETLAASLIEAWIGCGLTPPMWHLAQPAIQSVLVRRMAEAYRALNAYLIGHGVLARIDLKSRIRLDRPSGSGAFSPPARPRADAAPDGPGVSTRPGLAGPARVRESALARAAQETRLETGQPPLARLREQAQGVLGQLRRLLSERIAGYDASAAPAAPSPRLSSALARQSTLFAETELMPGPGVSALRQVPAEQVRTVAGRLRQRAAELKTQAETPSEKAIIEIVALMFQAILAEERLPPSIRVWFARLQIPVLRLALTEPDFFASVQHPARQLIDRMGACALGFDAERIGGSRLEREIKRVVQVIEQYPETGRRVYQLVLDEFRKFLGRSLAGDGAVRQAATLAQQVEQKEALSIQYTIELRRMLEPLAVHEDVREFLFHVWSEVLALATVRHGPQHAETLRFKQTAADLLWAASPHADRAERGSLLQNLAGIIAVLREGMGSLAILDDEQDGHIKLLSDAVMQAFVSSAEGLSSSVLDQLGRGLAELEDVVTDEPEGDILLGPGMIELLFDVEGQAPEVIATGGAQPSEGMLRWTRELELGGWFSLHHQGAVTQVQYVWRSARGRLHLLASSAGKSYLAQTHRLAAYLQAGLLVPLEGEPLTVRATRQALDRLNAAPEQLLS